MAHGGLEEGRSDIIVGADGEGVVIVVVAVVVVFVVVVVVTVVVVVAIAIKGGGVVIVDVDLQEEGRRASVAETPRRAPRATHLAASEDILLH